METGPDPNVTTAEAPSPRIGASGLALRLGVFFFLEWMGLQLFAFLFAESIPFFYASILATFFSAVLANSFAVRIYERGRLEHVGMGWAEQSGTHFWLGTAAGLAAALAVTALPVAAGYAYWTLPATPEAQFQFSRFAAAGIGLLFGAVGEELLFRGYGFQILLARFNPWLVLAVFSAIFGWMHHWNPAATLLSDINTAMWGAVLGYGLLRSGALWLPIGLHFGWNLGLPALGASLSGFPLPIGPRVLNYRLPELWSGGAYGPEGGLFCTLAAILTLIWIWRWPIRPQPGLLVSASQ